MSRSLFSFCLAALFLSGCASGTFKARQEQREKLTASTGMFCEFVSGDLFPDLDVELSLAMARRCDSSKNFTITNYKNSSDHSGVIYCCAAARAEKKAAASQKPMTPAKPEPAVSAEPEPVVE